MKTINNFRFILMLIGFALALMLLNSCSGNNVKQPVDVPYFTEGQILLPDYACPDTLIVMDAAGLNKAIAYVEQFNDTLVETDGEIDSLFHCYAIPYNR